MELSADQITIAITVYNRRDYVQQAIQSALDQTASVRVMVVEDCGPDPTLQGFIETKFGSRIRYHRNARRRGLFDNWNACLELCQTHWLSILHDDDFLKPTFVGAMLDLGKKAPGRGFYCGQVITIDPHGKQLPPVDFPAQAGWRELELVAFANLNSVLFPGQLVRTDYARALGGFRATSLFAGDWEMWFKLAAAHGGVQTHQPLAYVRAHSGGERGTQKIERSGKKFVLDNVQRKRNLGILKRMGYSAKFERQPNKSSAPFPSRSLLQNGAAFSSRILAYNIRLFLDSTPPHLAYSLLQLAVRLFGAKALRVLPQTWNGFLRK